MYKVITSTKDMPYEQWLEYRRQGIGGSDASILCGINKYKSPVELWLDKTGQLPAQEAGEAAYWGTVLESVVRSEFTKRTGIEVQELHRLLQSESHPFMQTNLDGICEHPQLGTCIFEAKTASAYKTNEWEDSIPDEYMLQIQHYMAVTGFGGTYIAVLIGGNTFKWRFVERDEQLISMLIKLESDFWNHVQSKTPPPMDGSSAAAKFLAERYPNSIKTQIALPNSASELVQQYHEADVQLKEFTEQKQQAENCLKELLGNNESGVVENYTISWKQITQERLDSKTLKAEHPTLYKKYAIQTTYRRFGIK